MDRLCARDSRRDSSDYPGGVPDWVDRGPINPIDQDVLLAPEVQVEEGGVDIERLLRPALDTIWQASGWPGSEGYDESGKWVGFTRFLTR